MTANLEELQILVAAGESSTLEFKKSTANLKGAAESLCAFLNDGGGQVLIGVTDSGEIVGQHVTDNTQQEIAAVIRKFEPAINVTVTYCELSRCEKKVIVMSAIPDKRCTPYTFNGRAYERIGATTSQMNRSKYQQLLIEQNMNIQSWDSLPANNVRIEDLDEEEIAKTVQLGISANRVDPMVASQSAKEVLHRLKLLDDSRVTNAAVVLFCKDMPVNFMNCLIRMARFKGVTKGSFIDSRRLDGNAFKLLQEAETFIQRHVSISSRFEEGQFQRIDEPEYPPSALREALINALCHRDYSIQGGTISLAIYDDRIEITSPGLLPNGVTVQSLKEVHDSKPRNDGIANVFFRRGMIETFGIGTQAMVEACREYECQEPDFIERNDTFVVCFWAKHHQRKSKKNVDLSSRQREILNILSQYNSLSAREIYNKMTKPPAERTLRHDLSHLKDLALINSKGFGPSAVWFLEKEA
ncbi:MAG: ATP-binding protein [Pseudomonadota bacterium]